MRRDPSIEEKCCPFLNQDDPRCASRFSLQRIDQAFSYCLGQYFGCPTFARLVREQGEPRPPAIHVTVEGDHPRPLTHPARRHVG